MQSIQKEMGEGHFGLDKIKKRILEYLAVSKLNPEGKTPILCFVGPPGLGKTFLTHSIAQLRTSFEEQTNDLWYVVYHC